MGATRESSWSGGILVWSGGEAPSAERCIGIVAKVSPGTIAKVQTITSRYRKVALKNFRLVFIAASALDQALEQVESIEHEHA